MQNHDFTIDNNNNTSKQKFSNPGHYNEIPNCPEDCSSQLIHSL